MASSASKMIKFQPPLIGWIGLGRMGAPMALNVSRQFPVIGYDQLDTACNNYLERAKAKQSLDMSKNNNINHVNNHEPKVVSQIQDLVKCGCNMYFFSVPTSQDVDRIADTIFEAYEHGMSMAEMSDCYRVTESDSSKGFITKPIFVDCSSGDYYTTQSIGLKMQKRGYHMVDSPVSGGPAGAESGTLAAIIGMDCYQPDDYELADSTDTKPTEEEIQYYEALKNHILSVISLFSTDKEKVHVVGRLGSGHAVKSINNILNATNLMLATEGLCSLQKTFDIPPDAALQCINSSSGQSLQTKERIPNEVLTRKFDYGFQYGLMEKDIRQAREILDNTMIEKEMTINRDGIKSEYKISSDLILNEQTQSDNNKGTGPGIPGRKYDSILHHTARVFCDPDNGCDRKGDYTEICKLYEREYGVELHNSSIENSMEDSEEDNNGSGNNTKKGCVTVKM